MSLVGLGYRFGLVMVLLAEVLQVEAESTVETITLTLYDVTRTKEAESPGVLRSRSRALHPAGTASDGSATTFSEEVVEYEMTVSEGATSTISTASWRDLRIQSASGYARIRTGPAFSGVQSCSYASGSGDCLEIIHNFRHPVFGPAAATATGAMSRILLASEATVTPVQTLTVIKTVPVTSSTSLPPSKSNSDILEPALLGSLLGGLGLILIALGLFLLSRRQRRNNKGQKRSLSRGSVVSGGKGGFGDHRYHYQSSRVTPSMAESSKDGVSIDSSYFPKSHYTKSPPHSPRHSFSAPTLPSRYQATSSPLSSVPYSADSEAERDSNQGTLTSLSTIVPSAAASKSRENTTDSIISTHSSTHPGHGFRIHPSRFIEGLSLSPAYRDSLRAGGDLQMLYREANEIEPENPSHPHQDHDHDHEREDGQTSSPSPETTTHLQDHDREEEPPHSLPPSSPSPHDSPYFVTPSETPNLGTFSPSSSSLPPASRSAPHLPYAPTHTLTSHSTPHLPYAPTHPPTTPTFPPLLTSPSWVTPSTYSHQTAGEDEHVSDSVTPTVEKSRARSASRSPSSHSPSQSHSRPPSSPASDDHGGGGGGLGTQNEYAV